MFNYKIDYLINEYDYLELLENANLEFSSSNVSETVYFELNGIKFRVSTHKRPSVYDEMGNFSFDYKYENEKICENEVDMYFFIKDLLSAK